MVIILVDALSKEIVDKYDMENVKALMKDGVDTPKGYLGHTGSVTVVTHNVVTSGMLPKNMGWTNEGYRDVDGVLGPVGGLYITSNFGSAPMSALQTHAAHPHLSDYLDDTGKVFTISPKSYAAYAFAGPGSPQNTVITFGSATCNGVGWRGPTGRNVPSYITADPCGRYWVERDKGYDTLQEPASLYPALDDRYVVGDGPATRAATSGRRTLRSTSWSTRPTRGAASSSACPASTRPPTCGAASMTRRPQHPGTTR